MAEGVTEQATFPIEMFPNDRLFLGMWPKVCKSWRTLYLDVDHVKKDNLLMSSVIRGMDVQKKHTKEGIWAVLKRNFILQGRKELLMPPLRHHLCGHSASLRMGIPVFCLRASLRWLTHLKVLLTCTFLWPPPFLPHFFAGSPKVWW